MENLNIDENVKELVSDIVNNINFSKLTCDSIVSRVCMFIASIDSILKDDEEILKTNYKITKTIEFYTNSIHMVIQKQTIYSAMTYRIIHTYLLWYVQKIDNRITLYFTAEELQNSMNDYILNEEFSNEKIIEMAKEIKEHKELENNINGVKNGNC